MKLTRIDNFIYLWSPVLPFIGYWLLAYCLFNFGPFITPEITAGTHIYVLVCLSMFVVAYKFGLGSKLKVCYRLMDLNINYHRENLLALNVLKQTSWLLFIGSVIFVFDRFNSGAGSFELVKNELANLRSDYSDKTTFLTTIGVFPQSFRIVAFSSYFYCIAKKLQIPNLVHALFFSIVVLEIVNMIISAHRGPLFWLGTYVFFLVSFCLKIKVIKELFSVRYFYQKILFIVFCLISFYYFYFIAKNREVESTTIYLGMQASYLLKYPLSSDFTDYGDIAAKYQLFYYLTDGFRYIESIYNNAPILNFDLLSGLGIRVQAQIQRFIPGYSFPANVNMGNWIFSAGLSAYGWPTALGASMAYFGIFGSPIFFYSLGFLSGYSTRRYIQTNRLGWLIIVLTFFTSLNMSFDWIIRNFDQYLALAYGIYLIFIRKDKVMLHDKYA